MKIAETEELISIASSDCYEEKKRTHAVDEGQQLCSGCVATPDARVVPVTKAKRVTLRVGPNHTAVTYCLVRVAATRDERAYTKKVYLNASDEFG